MSTTVYFAVLIALTVMTIAYLVILGKGTKRFQELMDILPDAEHPLKFAYPFGFQVLDMIHYSYTSKADKKYIGYCKVFYGENNGQFYYCINLTQKLSVSALVLVLGIPLGLLMNSIVIVVFAVLAAAGIAYYYHTLITDIVNERTEEIMSDFPDVLSKLALLVNAGMILNEAWSKVSVTGERTLYKEMQNAVFEMQNGISDFDAYINFARRCSVPVVTKFTSTLVQNLSKGNKELVQFLHTFADESWNEKKQEAKRKGEVASTKMLLPICIMFLGIMLMIMLPIFSGMSM